MKKLLGIVLVLTLVFTLFACDDTPPSETSADYTLPPETTAPTESSSTNGTTPSSETTRPHVDLPGPETDEMKAARELSYDIGMEFLFSKAELVEALMSVSGFSEETATYAANYCGISWKEQAVRKADDYLQSSIVHIDSRAELSSALAYHRFTESETAHGVASCRVNWNERAVLRANRYLDDYSTYQKEQIRSFLINDDSFTESEAAFGLENCKGSWNG